MFYDVLYTHEKDDVIEIMFTFLKEKKNNDAFDPLWKVFPSYQRFLQ